MSSARWKCKNATEQSFGGAYASPLDLVPKKNGEYRITSGSPVWGFLVHGVRSRVDGGHCIYAIPISLIGVSRLLTPLADRRAKCLRVLALIDDTSLGVKQTYGRLHQLSTRLGLFFVTSLPLARR